MVRSVAKVFMSGRSLAVGILRSFRFDVPEVFIVRKGDSVVLTPRRAMTWSRFFEECACPDFALDRKASQRGQKRDIFNSRYMLDTDIASYVI